MGISFMKSCGVYPSTTAVNAPNPDPARFEVLEARLVGRNVVARIRYPDCINFEGVKICVFLNETVNSLRNRVRIDPHFSTSDKSPFARFAPTDKGWEEAIDLAKRVS